MEQAAPAGHPPGVKPVTARRAGASLARRSPPTRRPPARGSSTSTCAPRGGSPRGWCGPAGTGSL